MTGLNISGSGRARFGEVSDWEAQLDALPHEPSDMSADSGHVTVTAERKPDSVFVQGAVLGYDHPVAGTHTGNVVSVDHSGELDVTIEIGTAFSKSVADREIPAVDSGSIVGAVDLVQNITLGRRLTYTGPGPENSLYWPLAGHSTCFDEKTNIVYGVNRDSANAYLYIDESENATYDVTRYVDTQRVFNSSGYTQVGDLLYSAGGIGYSLTPSTTLKHFIRFEVAFTEEERACAFSVAFGPLDDEEFTGKSLTFTLDADAQTLGRNFQYYSSISGPLTVTDSQDVSTLDFDLPIEFLVTSRFVDTAQYGYEVRLTDGTTTLNYSFTNSNTAIDIFSYQFTISGAPIRDLVTTEAGVADTIGDFHSGISLTSPTAHYDTTAMVDLGGRAPIAGYVGTMWDYLKQVAGARGIELIDDDGVIVMREVKTSVLELKNVEGTRPNRTIDNSGAALFVEFKNYDTQITEFSSNYSDFLEVEYSWGEIYNAADEGDTWTIGVNETSTVILAIDHFPSVVENPIPVSNIIVKEE